MTTPSGRRPFPVHIPFVEALGFELLRFDDGHAEVALDVRPDQWNSWQVAHGGVMMTLLDVALAHAARSPRRGEAEDADTGVATIEMKTSFLQPAEGRLVARGRLLHRTRSLAFCEGDVVDAAGRTCAHATGTFKYLRTLGGRTRMAVPDSPSTEGPET